MCGGFSRRRKPGNTAAGMAASGIGSGMGRAAGTRVPGPAGRVAALGLLAVLAGCGHRDAVDTPVSWWHQLEGGAIAQQRPPPPGVDDPYPRIGTTPATAPQVASIGLRQATTAGLIEQRNLSARLNAHDPLPPPSVPPAKAAARPAPPAASASQSSAVLDAADAPPAPTPTATPTPRIAVPPVAALPHAAAPVEEAGLSLPAVVPPAPGQADPGAPVVLPAIPAAPPPPPTLPGIETPPPPAYAPPPRPAYALAAQPGDALQFPAGSDVLAASQGGTLHAIAVRRGAGTVFVHGYGDAASDAPHDQSTALTLAAFRARAVAEALEREGVPASAIRISAAAFGRGASAGLVE